VAGLVGILPHQGGPRVVVHVRWVLLVSSRLSIWCSGAILLALSEGSGVSQDIPIGQGGLWHLCRVAGVQRVVLACVLVAIICSIMERWIWMGRIVKDGFIMVEVSEWLGKVLLWLGWGCGGSIIIDGRSLWIADISKGAMWSISCMSQSIWQLRVTRLIGLLVLGMVKLVDKGVGRVRGKAGWCGDREGNGIVVVVGAKGGLGAMSFVLC